jgi:tetratricopeptide (TPR) repeat protein
VKKPHSGAARPPPFDKVHQHQSSTTTGSDQPTTPQTSDDADTESEDQLPPTVRTQEEIEMIEIIAACMSNRAACYTKLQRHEDVVSDCTFAIQYKPTYLKALQRRADSCEHLANKAIASNESVEASGKLQMAVDDFHKVVELDPTNNAARYALYRLEPELKRQNEKMKDEMIDKLKGFGNFLLGKVGLSLDNFKTEKDPVTGSINIQFQQNK